MNWTQIFSCNSVNSVTCIFHFGEGPFLHSTHSHCVTYGRKSCNVITTWSDVYLTIIDPAAMNYNLYFHSRKWPTEYCTMVKSLYLVNNPTNDSSFFIVQDISFRELIFNPQEVIMELSYLLPEIGILFPISGDSTWTTQSANLEMVLKI